MQPVLPCIEQMMSYLVTQFITVSPLSPETTQAPSPRRWEPRRPCRWWRSGSVLTRLLLQLWGSLIHSHRRVAPLTSVGTAWTKWMWGAEPPPGSRGSPAVRPALRLSRQDSGTEPRLWVLSASLAMSITSASGTAIPAKGRGPATCHQKGLPRAHWRQGMGGSGGGQEGEESDLLPLC